MISRKRMQKWNALTAMTSSNGYLYTRTGLWYCCTMIGWRLKWWLLPLTLIEVDQNRKKVCGICKIQISHYLHFVEVRWRSRRLIDWSAKIHKERKKRRCQNSTRSICRPFNVPFKSQITNQNATIDSSNKWSSVVDTKVEKFEKSKIRRFVVNVCWIR